jgi:hypothetical protein
MYSSNEVWLWYLDGCVWIGPYECVLCMQLNCNAVDMYSSNEMWLWFLDGCV